MPQTGVVECLHWPVGPNIRIETGIAQGQMVSSFYDPMLAKVIAYGHTREEARTRLIRALEDTCILGFRHNLGFLLHILKTPEMESGQIHTGLLDTWSYQVQPSSDLAMVAGLIDRVGETTKHSDKTNGSNPLGSWSNWGMEAMVMKKYLQISQENWALNYELTDNGVICSVDHPELNIKPAYIETKNIARGKTQIQLFDSSTRELFLEKSLFILPLTRGVWIQDHGEAWYFAYKSSAKEDDQIHHDNEVFSPMPGKIVAISLLNTPAVVKKGDAVMVIEAMKMEQTLVAPMDGVIEKISWSPGDRVDKDQLLFSVNTNEEQP